MADIEYVDLLIGPEHRLAVERELHEWYRQQGNNRVWVQGNEAALVVFCDVPTAALECLERRSISYDTRPRPPSRPLPVPVATMGGAAGP